MSLKVFHIVFITLSLVMCFGAGALEIRSYAVMRDLLHLAVGLICLAGGVGLVFYLKSVLKKYKNFSVAAFCVFLVFYAQNSLACSVCYGDPDSPMARGLVSAVLTLLAVIVFVLSLFAALMVRFYKRSKLYGSMDQCG